MVHSDSKKIMVIKNIPSMYIEEAIIILKADVETIVTQKKGFANVFNMNKNNKDFIVKEAEAIIHNFIKENKLYDKNRASRTRYNDANKKKIQLNLIINIAMTISLALLIFVITKLV